MSSPLEMANYGQRRTDGHAIPARVEALLVRALDDVEKNGLRDSEGNPHPLLGFLTEAYAAGTNSRRLKDERRARTGAES